MQYGTAYADIEVSRAAGVLSMSASSLRLSLRLKGPHYVWVVTLSVSPLSLLKVSCMLAVI